MSTIRPFRQCDVFEVTCDPCADAGRDTTVVTDGEAYSTTAVCQHCGRLLDMREWGKAEYLRQEDAR